MAIQKCYTDSVVAETSGNQTSLQFEFKGAVQFNRIVISEDQVPIIFQKFRN